MSRATLCVLALLIVGFPGAALAQDTLSSLLPRAFAQVVTANPDSSNSAASHQTHFFAALGEQGQAAFALNKLMVLQLDTFPLPTSSGAFAVIVDPETGLFKSGSKSFGSGYAERALTNGRGRFEFGINYQRVAFKSFEGLDLGSNELRYGLQHNDCCGTPAGESPDAPPFEDDAVTISPVIDLSANTFAPYFSYGLTNRWDVAAVVPIVKVDLDTSVTATIARLGLACPDAAGAILHTWDGTCTASKVVQMRGDATGIGDIALRTKYRFFDAPQGGLAAGLDLRLPTGDKEELLGTGATRTKFLLIASGEFSRFSPHANIGYTISSGKLSAETTAFPLSPSDAQNAATRQQIEELRTQALGGDLDVPNEFDYIAGLDVAAHPLLTISGDIIGRTVLDVERFDAVSKTFTGPLGSITLDNFQSTGAGNLNLVLAALGAKFNIPGTHFLLTGSVVFPLTDGGLRPKVTPVIGLDYSFGR